MYHLSFFILVFENSLSCLTSSSSLRKIKRYGLKSRGEIFYVMKLGVRSLGVKAEYKDRDERKKEAFGKHIFVLRYMRDGKWKNMSCTEIILLLLGIYNLDEQNTKDFILWCRNNSFMDKHDCFLNFQWTIALVITKT